MSETTETVQTPAGSQTATPSATSGQNQQGAEDAATLRKQLEDLNKRLAEKDTYINEVTSEKAALEQRLSVVKPAGTAVDPQEIARIVKEQSFVEKVRDENKDLVEIGLEPAISLRADQLMRGGKTFEEAVKTAVKETRDKFDAKFKKTKEEPVTPAGAQGESSGQGSEPAPKAVVEAPLADEGSARQVARSSKGL